jgi:hypothetical protein
MIEKTIKRDPEGRFERHGKALSKTQKKKKSANALAVNNTDKPRNKGGRPKGSLNKTTLALKEAILAALDKVGGPDYLATLAIENSSAFAGLLGKVLPSTLAASDSTGGKTGGITFERIIVWPDGHREIEGVTPKSLPAPDASHALPNSTSPTDDDSDIK